MINLQFRVGCEEEPQSAASDKHKNQEPEEMIEEERKGEIPSYRNAVTREDQNTSNQAGETKNPGPVLGAQAGSRGKCLPCAMETKIHKPDE